MKKAAHYRRAVQINGEISTIQAVINQCQDQYPDDAYPNFQFKNGTDCIVAKHASTRGRDFVHLVTYERGAGAAVIETLQNPTVDEQPAPEQKEFIQSQMFLICSGNNLIWTVHNSPVRDSGINMLINRLIDSFGDYEEPPEFLLEATLDEARFRELMRDGIEEIDLAVGGYRETLEYALNNGRIERAGIFSVIASLGTRDRTEEEIEASENIMTRLTLRPGRNWDNINIKNILADISTDILGDHDDGFSIITKNGLRITKDAMRVKDDFFVDGNRRVVDIGQIENALHAAYDQFNEMGVLER
ncbi:MAG: hypothetical protein JKX94_08025 [Sneathiella sp.]|nr:hypothetical protein [Sneathiella sp.]